MQADRILSPGLSRRLMRVSVSRISLAMGLSGLLLIALTTAFIVQREREVVFREARQDAQEAAFSLADHASRLFEVSDLALRTLKLALKDQGWDEAASDAGLRTEAEAVIEALPYLKDLHLFDETGRLRISTFASPTPPLVVADRPIFARVRDGGDAIVIGEPVVGALTHVPTFVVARRLASADGRFRGMVAATADLHYLTDYWRRRELPYEAHVAIVRAETGGVLARLPESPPMAPGSMAALRLSVATFPVAGRYVPTPERLGYYHRIGDLPLYLTVSFSSAAVERGLGAWLWSFLLFPASAVLALAAITVLARRQSRTEALANREVVRARVQLAAANQNLERRVAERTADLAESNAELQSFTYIVSHDLRAPLINITGFTSELQRLRPQLFNEGAAPDAGPATPEVMAALQEDFDEAIGFIQSSIVKMDRLINAILLLARKGNRAFEPERVDTTALMRSIADGVAHRAHAVGATLTIAPLPELVIDRIAAEQLFSNLVDNAVKYLRPGVPGEISVTAEPVDGDRAAFRVADNGRGIDPRDHARVFDLFRRSGPQDQPGDGIGLAHVRILVRQVGGTISLASVPGHGTTITVVLPLLPKGHVP